MVPHLITALSGPINELEQRILESLPAIERWFRLEWMEHTPAFYTSVDVRNAGFKLAPVDTSLFPGCFQLLTDDMLPLAVQAAMAAIEKICPEAKNLLLIPERSADTDALMNVAQLTRIFHQAGMNVRLGSIDETIAGPTPVELPDGTTLTLEPLVRTRGRLGLKHFDPCTILLNTQLAGGVPKVLEGIHEQYLLPPLHAGWTMRRRNQHVHAYEEVAKKFAKLLGMDPWLINPMHASCGEVDFADDAAADCLMTNSEALLAKVRRKYKEYGIQEKPFVIVKADGPAGSAVHTVRDVKEIGELCRQWRDGSTASQFREVLLQEGVPTYERVNDAAAEPVVYMIDRYVVGGFYRIHPERGPDESLNAPGCSYVPLALAESGQFPKLGAKQGAAPPNRFYMYGVIARLAMVAAAYELEANDPDAEVYE
ncbi:glutamate--cysteine ligase [Piscinibacter sakaiensis]|uniref:glutamate--cysteine ligase n=1 Tax=Piscinibacter sakaiensis TaxID=1547922 RepID=UPI003AB0A919